MKLSSIQLCAALFLTAFLLGIIGSNPLLPVISKRISSAESIPQTPSAASSSFFNTVNGNAPLYYLPVTLVNSQGSATPTNFQARVSINSNVNSIDYAPNLSNVNWQDGNGNLLNSWLESGNSNTATASLYWVNLGNLTIPAGNNITIYQILYATSVNAMNTNNTGESPQLSGTYGQYDDGANVFPFYDNFAGNSLSGKWSNTGSDVAVNNGMTITEISLPDTAVWSVSQFNDSIYSTDWYGYVEGNTYSYDSIWLAWYNYTFGGYDYGISVSHALAGGTGFEIGSGTNAALSGNPTTSTTEHLFQYYSLGSTAYAMLDYGTVANLAVTTHNTSVSAGASATFASTAIIFIQYVRLRATPPSGVMPTVTIGAINTINTSIPLAPTLSAITPSPSITGNVTLAWTASVGATLYHIYRSTSTITSVGSLTPITTPTGTTYQDTLTVNGTYYYAITAVNASGESNCSNCQNVSVAISSSSNNLIVNPGFENGLTGWNTLYGTGVYSVDSMTAHSGNYSCLYLNNGTADRLYQDVINITSPWNHYQINGWIKTSNMNGGAAVIELAYVSANGWTPSDGYVMNIGHVSGTQDWAFYQSPVFTLPPLPSDGQALRVILGCWYGNGTAWFDDVSLVNINGTSTAPILSAITPNPNTLGNVTLEWSAVSGVHVYGVYVSSSPINNTSTGLSLITYVNDQTSYTDDESNGTYYYAINSVNESNYGDFSPPSNCQSVVVNASPPSGAPVLAAITPNPSYSEYISLSWSAVNNALGYYVYESASPISTSNVGNLSWIANVLSPQTAYTDYEGDNGTYYYAIMAYNGGGTSSPSNCQSVVAVINPIPMSTYVGVVPGTTFRFALNIYSSNEAISGMSNGIYDWVLVVDNATDNGRSATIGFHTVLSNSTNSSISAYSDSQTIGATDTTASINQYFINTNIANKTYNTGLQNISGNLQWENATWNNNGVISNMSMWGCDNGQVLIETLTLTSTSLPAFPPAAPAGLTIVPNPSTNGTVMLTWTASSGATSYKIYRYTSPITSINSSVTLVATVTITYYTETLTASGIYYYVAEATNSAGDSAISNCQSVRVILSITSSTTTSTTNSTPSTSSNTFGIPNYSLQSLFMVSSIGIGVLFVRQKRKLKALT